MMIWLIILGLTIFAVLTGVIYMMRAVGDFALIHQLEKKWQRMILSLGIIALCFAVVAYTLNTVNAIIVFLHVLIAFLLFEIAFLIVSKTTGKMFDVNWKGWLAILSAILYLSVGFYLCHNIWQTGYHLNTEKEIGKVRVALIADSHLGATLDGEEFTKQIQRIKDQNPDILLIAGDYVDDDSTKADMIAACKALGSIDLKYGVWFAYGNHDQGYFDGRDFSADELVQEMKKNGIHILEDESEAAGPLCIVGRKDPVMGARKELSELLEGVDRDRYIIVLDHEPTDYEKESETDADLVLSGHTHGGQLLPLGQIAEALGINDRSYGYERRNDTDFLVTSGISDWAIDFKTGTKSEYVIIDITEGEV